MRRRVIEIQLDRYASTVRGFGSFELLVEVTGRQPVWLSRLKVFSCQEHTAKDVIAAAERRGYDVVVTGPRSTANCQDPDILVSGAGGDVDHVDHPDNEFSTSVENPDPGRGLW